MIAAIRRTYFKIFAHYRRLELRLIPWDEADALIRKNEGWRIAKEEDTNRRTPPFRLEASGYCIITPLVYLERVERIK
jgi:hypothetical protein